MPHSAKHGPVPTEICYKHHVQNVPLYSLKCCIPTASQCVTSSPIKVSRAEMMSSDVYIFEQ